MQIETKMRVVEMDYETHRRQKWLAELQRMDVAAGLVWIAIMLFGALAMIALGEKVFDYVHGIGGLIR